ncbi:hypothetical protein JAAARDRAFT_437735 [Jaapia argillacea MUCL 33604]|uniref:Uncharacterized protein n=1 Tax=Jaapia argillacea MUCL 33604 TaxID=933084 RepID=A0A067PS92_9AGAM|nr:hypothetical protein JAAARDRAFT_437735 [Jaapia argillacea MUCL 33604]
MGFLPNKLLPVGGYGLLGAWGNDPPIQLQLHPQQLLMSGHLWMRVHLWTRVPHTPTGLSTENPVAPPMQRLGLDNLLSDSEGTHNSAPRS